MKATSAIKLNSYRSSLVYQYIYRWAVLMLMKSITDRTDARIILTVIIVSTGVILNVRGSDF